MRPLLIPETLKDNIYKISQNIKLRLLKRGLILVKLINIMLFLNKGKISISE